MRNALCLTGFSTKQTLREKPQIHSTKETSHETASKQPGSETRKAEIVTDTRRHNDHVEDSTLCQVLGTSKAQWETDNH